MVLEVPDGSPAQLAGLKGTTRLGPAASPGPGSVGSVNSNGGGISLGDIIVGEKQYAVNAFFRSIITLDTPHSLSRCTTILDAPYSLSISTVTPDTHPTHSLIYTPSLIYRYRQ